MFLRIIGGTVFDYLGLPVLLALTLVSDTKLFLLLGFAGILKSLRDKDGGISVIEKCRELGTRDRTGWCMGWRRGI